MHFCAEISYTTPKGGAHSDICFSCTEDKQMTDDYRQFIHACLDEWLDNANGTGAFWLAGEKWWNETKREAVLEYLEIRTAEIIKEMKKP